MNYRTILIAAVFHFVQQVKKDFKTSRDDTKLSKQVSRRCINFPYELTCHILTNRNIKIGRSA